MKFLLINSRIILVFSIFFNSHSAIAQSIKFHKIGTFNSPAKISGCSYWRDNSKQGRSTSIFRTYRQSGEDKALAKIDNREIKLKRAGERSEGNYTIVVFKGVNSQVEISDYFHSSTVRVPVSITFIHDGWRKTVTANYECSN